MTDFTIGDVIMEDNEKLIGYLKYKIQNTNKTIFLAIKKFDFSIIPLIKKLTKKFCSRDNRFDKDLYKCNEILKETGIYENKIFKIFIEIFIFY